MAIWALVPFLDRRAAKNQAGPAFTDFGVGILYFLGYLMLKAWDVGVPAVAHGVDPTGTPEAALLVARTTTLWLVGAAAAVTLWRAMARRQRYFWISALPVLQAVLHGFAGLTYLAAGAVSLGLLAVVLAMTWNRSRAATIAVVAALTLFGATGRGARRNSHRRARCRRRVGRPNFSACSLPRAGGARWSPSLRGSISPSCHPTPRNSSSPPRIGDARQRPAAGYPSGTARSRTRTSNFWSPTTACFATRTRTTSPRKPSSGAASRTIRTSISTFVRWSRTCICDAACRARVVTVASRPTRTCRTRFTSAGPSVNSVWRTGAGSRASAPIPATVSPASCGASIRRCRSTRCSSTAKAGMGALC